MIKAGAPDEFHQGKSEPSIAIEEIDRITAAGVLFGCVLAGADYGLSAFQAGRKCTRAALGHRYSQVSGGIPC